MARNPDHQAPELSITSVLFNSAATLERYAEPLRELLASGFAELIAVDNASPDGSAARLEALLPGIKLITAPRNLGFAGGCNLAWPHTRGRYWLLLNPDVEASAEGIKDLVRWMDAHPGVAIGTPMLNDEGGSPTSVARTFPTLRWTVGEMLRIHRLINARTRSERLLGPYWDGEPRDVGWVPFASAIIRREAVEQVGPLSDELFMYGEDLELCWRVRRAGWKVAICGDATFTHTGGSSAAATWGEEERSERLAAGIASALRLIRGRIWTRVYAGILALSHFLDSISPRREAGQRRSNRLAAHAWLRQVLAGGP
jgi:GT2 family glycosyltransferase